MEFLKDTEHFGQSFKKGEDENLGADVEKFFGKLLFWVESKVFNRISKRVNWLLRHTEGFINVKDYGAVGDGNTDDTTAIQTAFDTGKSVLIPEGIFIVNSTLSWTTDYATLFFVSHLSVIKAGATFPVDTPVIHFAGDANSNVQHCMIYNLNVDCNTRASGILLTRCGHLSFYSPQILNGRNGDDNYSFDVRGTYGHTSTIWVHGLHIYGSDEGGGIRLDGDGYDLFRFGFWGAHIQHIGHAIYLKARCHGNYFSQMMIDIAYDNAGAFGIKEESGVDNKQNVFDTVITESAYTSGTGIDMQATTSYSTMWNYWIVRFSTASVFDDFISQKNLYAINGVQLRSRGRKLVLHGAFDGYSPDSTMTWDAGKAAVAGDGTWDKWDFILPLPHNSIIATIQNRIQTDDGNADLRLQVWKQSSQLSTWVQVGADHDFTGDGYHTATIDYTIEINYVVKISILAKRAAGTYLYVLPLNIKADY